MEAQKLSWTRFIATSNVGRLTGCVNVTKSGFTVASDLVSAHLGNSEFRHIEVYYMEDGLRIGLKPSEHGYTMKKKGDSDTVTLSCRAVVNTLKIKKKRYPANWNVTSGMLVFSYAKDEGK